MKLRRLHSILALVFFGATVSGQEIAYTGNPDISFFAARDLAFDGKRSAAQDTLRQVLTRYPDYADVRNLLASTYSWDGEFELARIHFNKITSVARTNKETWVAAIKNELYAEEYYLALGLANKALIHLPDDTDILKLRNQARTNRQTRNKPDDKLNEQVGALLDTMEVRTKKNRIGLTTSYDMFDKIYDPMAGVSMEYKRETNMGPLLARVNYANRFNTSGLQFELDFYPKLSKLFYGYLNYGYSNASIFPHHRAGAEIFSNWPKLMELSLGVRYLNFAGIDIDYYTGSVGLYRDNYYFSLRSYITPDNQSTGVSGTLLARRFLKDRQNYLGITIGYGVSPELKQLRNGDALLAETLLFIESQQLLFEYQFTGKKSANTYRTNLGFTRQELVFDSGNYFWAVSAGLTYQTRF